MRRIHRPLLLGQRAAASRYVQAVLADSPLLFWKLDEASGATTFADAAGSFPGTGVGAYTAGAASVFSGGAAAVAYGGAAPVAYVKSASSPWPASGAAFSFECCFHVDSLANEIYLMGRGVNSPTFTAALRIETNGQMQWLIVEDSATLSFCNSAAGLISAGGDYHAVCSYNPTGHAMRLTVNGGTPLTGTGTGAVLHTDTGYPLTIGAGITPDSANFSFAGRINMAAVYAGVLPDARISAHYAAR